MSCANYAPPLQLPIKANPVSISAFGAARGIATTLGNPHQLFSMRPGANENNTFVSNLYQCITNTNYSCIAEHGGVYDPNLSHPTPITTNSVASWNGTPGVDVEDGNYVFFNDYLEIAGHGIPGFPFFTFADKPSGGKRQSLMMEDHH